MNNRPHDEHIIIIFTAGWRFLAALSLLAFLTQFLLYISGFSGEYPMAAGILFFLCTAYFTFRLWLDHRLFCHLAQSADTDIFDESLTTLFPGRTHHTHYSQRWQGTKRLFQQGALCMVLQWIVTVVALLN